MVDIEQSERHGKIQNLDNFTRHIFYDNDKKLKKCASSKTTKIQIGMYYIHSISANSSYIRTL